MPQAASCVPKVLTLSLDAAWTWFNDPRAVFHKGVLYFGFMRVADGKSVLRAYNPADRSIVELWSSSWSEVDDHDNPGILKLLDGGLMAFYARHDGSSTNLEYRRASGAGPHLECGWEGEKCFSSSQRISYANPFQLSGEKGRIFHFMRNVNFNPTFITSDDCGQSWSGEQLFIQTGNGAVRPYVKYCSDGLQRIDFLYTDGHPRDEKNSLYHGYYENGWIFKTGGTGIKPMSESPLLHDLGERGEVVYQFSEEDESNPDVHIPGGRAWCWQVERAPDGNPVCVFTVQCDDVTGTGWMHDRIYYFYAKWCPDAGWRKKFIAQAGRPLYAEEDDYAGGICLDPSDPDVVYLSTSAARPFDLSSTVDVPLNPDARFELYRGVTGDGGETFTWQPLTANSSEDHIRPFVPLHHEDYPLSLLWMKGTYRSYTDWSTSLEGVLGKSIPSDLALNHAHLSHPRSYQTIPENV